MVTLEERVAFLEGRVGEHSHMLTGIREAVVGLEQRMDRRFEGLDQRLTVFEQRFDRRFETVDRQFQSVELRLTGLEQRLEHGFARVDERFDAQDGRTARYFMWLAGLMVTTLGAALAAVLTVVLTR